MTTIRSRAPKFVPEILKALKMYGQFECRFQDVPLSYQRQPYNLAAKLKSRGEVIAKVYFNKANDTFTCKLLSQLKTSSSLNH